MVFIRYVSLVCVCECILSKLGLVWRSLVNCYLILWIYSFIGVYEKWVFEFRYCLDLGCALLFIIVCFFFFKRTIVEWEIKMCLKEFYWCKVDDFCWLCLTMFKLIAVWAQICVFVCLCFCLSWTWKSKTQIYDNMLRHLICSLEPSLFS